MNVFVKPSAPAREIFSRSSNGTATFERQKNLEEICEINDNGTPFDT
ncbi:hypothetical protein HDF16_004927 [Granulicella aggregans]|uniref:Uncharacterized protein n=1 Tax=Granulicella aggregans TaxID=474949 RepID=A0A7W7ZJ90_9BACT|nr:hypothetical protein [Granulicella aggregans]